MGLIHSPRIVTDGLVLALDAGNTKSYPGSGTTWTDLSGRGNNGTLTNGPTYNSSDGGSIVFDGSNDFVSLPISSEFNTDSVTMEVWAKLQSTGNRQILMVNWSGNSLEVNSDRSVQFFIWNGSQIGTSASTIAYSNWGEWGHFVGTYNSSSTTLSLYMNSVLISSVSTSKATYSVSVHKISGTDYGGPISGNVSIARHYNKALTASEIKQNFNATRGRYGL